MRLKVNWLMHMVRVAGLVGVMASACGARGGPAEVGWTAGASAEAESMPNLDGDETTGDLRIRWPEADPTERVGRYRVVQGESLLAEVEAPSHEALVGVRMNGGTVRIEACDKAERCTSPARSLTEIHLMVPIFPSPSYPDLGPRPSFLGEPARLEIVR